MIRALAIAMLALFSFAVPVAADTPSCVSKAEWHNVHRGDTKAHVHRVFDVSGTQVAAYDAPGGHYVIRSYPRCSGGDSTVTYRRYDGALRLADKAA